jgi:hypothetical protein
MDSFWMGTNGWVETTQLDRSATAVLAVTENSSKIN